MSQAMADPAEIAEYTLTHPERCWYWTLMAPYRAPCRTCFTCQRDLTRTVSPPVKALGMRERIALFLRSRRNGDVK